MREIDLQLEPNEASDLCPVLDVDARAEHGWDLSFATVLDEAPAERSLAILVHEGGHPLTSGWVAKRVRLKPDRAKRKTEDAEACSRHGGWLVMLGSQHGSKDGPLAPRRSWIARVHEGAIADALTDGGKPRLEVRRLRFGLHRAVNDAVAEADIDLIELGERTRRSFIDDTIGRGAAKAKRWAGTVVSSDHPINVEAAEFRDNGHLLLGLRHPCTAAGDPILVELENVEAIFTERAAPRCARVWVLEGLGSPDEPRGVRALHNRGGDEFEAIVGNLESDDADAVLVADHPAASRASSLQVRFALPLTAAGGPLSFEIAQEFDAETKRLEGVATAADQTFYVLDQDGRVALRALATA